MICILCLLSPLVASVASADSDSQLWLDFDFAGETSERSQVKGRQSFRFKEDVRELGTYFTELSVTHRTRNWLDLRLTYRHQFTKVGEVNWIQENRPFADATFKWVWGPLRMANRTRIEYRIREERPDEFRFRNALTELVDRPFTRISFRPYLSQEVFLDEENRQPWDATRFRFKAGFRADPEDRFLFVKLQPKEARQLKIDVYGVYEEQEWSDAKANTFAVGLTFGVYF